MKTRECLVTIEFTKHCLGNLKQRRIRQGKKQTFFQLPRDDAGRLVFQPNWWRANMLFAAGAIDRYEDLVVGFQFNPVVAGSLQTKEYRRYYGPKIYSLHEAIYPQTKAEIEVAVPHQITKDDFYAMMALAGEQMGISPFRPREFGFFRVTKMI